MARSRPRAPAVPCRPPAPAAPPLLHKIRPALTAASPTARRQPSLFPAACTPHAGAVIEWPPPTSHQKADTYMARNKLGHAGMHQHTPPYHSPAGRGQKEARRRAGAHFRSTSLNSLRCASRDSAARFCNRGCNRHKPQRRHAPTRLGLRGPLRQPVVGLLQSCHLTRVCAFTRVRAVAQRANQQQTTGEARPHAPSPHTSGDPSVPPSPPCHDPLDPSPPCPRPSWPPPPHETGTAK
jgi:hypothetical protein